MTRIESTSAAHVVKMTQLEEFDLVILGGGTGSTFAAWTFAGQGKRVAVVERKIHRRIMSEYRMLGKQKHHPQREGRIV